MRRSVCSNFVKRQETQRTFRVRIKTKKNWNSRDYDLASPDRSELTRLDLSNARRLHLNWLTLSLSRFEIFKFASFLSFVNIFHLNFAEEHMCQFSLFCLAFYLNWENSINFYSRSYENTRGPSAGPNWLILIWSW